MESIGLTKLDKPHSIRIAAGKWSNARAVVFCVVVFAGKLQSRLVRTDQQPYLRGTW